MKSLRTSLFFVFLIITQITTMNAAHNGSKIALPESKVIIDLTKKDGQESSNSSASSSALTTKQPHTLGLFLIDRNSWGIIASFLLEKIQDFEIFISMPEFRTSGVLEGILAPYFSNSRALPLNQPIDLTFVIKYAKPSVITQHIKQKFELNDIASMYLTAKERFGSQEGKLVAHLQNKLYSGLDEAKQSVPSITLILNKAADKGFLPTIRCLFMYKNTKKLLSKKSAIGHALWWAAAKNHKEVVKWFIENPEIQPLITDYYLNHSTMDAADKGYFDVVQEFITHKFTQELLTAETLNTLFTIANQKDCSKLIVTLLKTKNVHEKITLQTLSTALTNTQNIQIQDLINQAIDRKNNQQENNALQLADQEKVVQPEMTIQNTNHEIEIATQETAKQKQSRSKKCLECLIL